MTVDAQELRPFTDKRVSAEIFCRRPLVLVASKAQRQELSGGARHVPRHFRDRRQLGGNLEDGGDTFKLMPWRITRQHLNHGTTQTPADQHATNKTCRCRGRALDLTTDRLWAQISTSLLSRNIG